MRILGATAALSLVVHGAAIAWALHSPKPVPVSAVAMQPEEPGAEAELTIVEYLPDPVPPDEVSVVPPRRGNATTVVSRGTPVSDISRTDRRPQGETGPRTTPPVEPPKLTPSGQPPVRRLAMRSGPEVPRTSEQLAAASLASPDSPPLPDYPGLRTEVALDAARHRVRDGDPAARAEVVALEDAQQAEELKEQKDGSYKVDHTTYSAIVASDGTVKIRDKANLRVHGLTGTFDTTDWIMKNQGMDPYASAKLKMLDRTRDQRVEIGKVYRKAQLAQSARLMQANLDNLWATTPDVAARKQAVFDLWEECAETGDPALADGGAKARALLERFVQVKLHGPDGFTADELARLNARRRSRATFDPYH
ncbi:hypothetical protein BH11MYX3_BH11MYX3_13860 [soil metagenome]